MDIILFAVICIIVCALIICAIEKVPQITTFKGLIEALVIILFACVIAHRAGIF